MIEYKLCRMGGSQRKARLMGIKGMDLTKRQFDHISEMVYQICGINLKKGKEALVRGRLLKRLRVLGLRNFDEYMGYLDGKDGDKELNNMVDVITTNKTSFFREQAHFHYLKKELIPKLKGEGRIRFWSAACSSGEEPFSLAILLRETIPNIDQMDLRILATDISTTMLEKAQKAVYENDALKDLDPSLKKKYFIRYQGKSEAYQVKKNIRSMISLARLNLMDRWPMTGPFTAIFCRNVMIYFDKETQEELVDRFWNLLQAGGYFFVGHAEGLSSITHKFKYMKPAVYMRQT